MAAQLGNIDAIKVMLAKDPLTTRRHYSQMLREAVKNGHAMAAVKLLLSAGADVNAEDTAGKNALSHAASIAPVTSRKRA
jgi:hypothetical protein